MFGIGIEELVVIFVIALFVLGPERLPSLARDLGKAMRELRRASDELTEEFLRADQPRPEPQAPSAPTALAVPAPPAPPTEAPTPAGESARTDTHATEETTESDRKP
jgi:TatA/E family protein of Tat protein translocase